MDGRLDSLAGWQPGGRSEFVRRKAEGGLVSGESLDFNAPCADWRAWPVDPPVAVGYSAGLCDADSESERRGCFPMPKI